MEESLRRLCCGGLRLHQLPEALHVWHLTESYGRLRALAFEQNVEWGGCLVAAAAELSIGHVARGSASSVGPVCSPFDHAGYVGFAHVHLPDPLTGKPYLGFSDEDYRATLFDGDNLALVTNGDDVYALVRIADCTLPAQCIDPAEFADWRRLYKDQLAFGRRTGLVNAALWEANRELCHRIGFAFYHGAWGQPLECAYAPPSERRPRG